MDDLTRSNIVFRLLCRIAYHLAAIAPAASVWSSGVGIVRSHATDEITLITCFLLLFVSAGISAILYQPACGRANFGLSVSMILAMICGAKELLSFSSSRPPFERLNSCLWEYGTMLWCIAVAVLLSHSSPLKGGVLEPLPQVEQSHFASVNQSTRDWISERGHDDLDNPLETLSAAGSIYLWGLTGPASEISGQSDTTGTSISLSSKAPRPDPCRTARVDYTLDQAASLSMSPFSSQD